MVALVLSSCGGKGASEIEKTFNEWAQENVSSRYTIDSITYNTVGSMTDIIYTTYVFMDSKGASTKAMELFNEGCLQYVVDCIADTSLPTTNIDVAKISISLPDGNKDYYIGIYKDSIVTQPFTSGVRALSAMPQKSLGLFIETLNIIFTNMSEIVPVQYNADELLYNWLTAPGKPKTPDGFNEAIIMGVSSTIRNIKK